jgi:hypothetical protein
LRETNNCSWLCIQMGFPTHIWYHCLEDNLALSFNPIIQITLCWSSKGRVPGGSKILVLAECNSFVQKFIWTWHLCAHFGYITNKHCWKTENFTKWSWNEIQNYYITMEFKHEIQFTCWLMTYYMEIFDFDV